MIAIVGLSAVTLFVAYRTYGRLLPRLFRIDPYRPTPANAQRDDIDYVPCDRGPLLGQHFSAIAAAGPIVGPILAGAMFGWLPALLWILVGAIFVGGVHDFAALVASIRHRGDSIAGVVRKYVSGRAFVLFLLFVWLALVYIIVAFTDITASAFVGLIELEDGTEVSGAGIASSSLMYLILPIIMGLVVRSTGLSMDRATLIFLPLVAVSIWAGQKIPLDIAPAVRLLGIAGPEHEVVRKTWDLLLLIYCCIASVVPMWLLLQPRGQLGGYFLYAALGAGALGLMMGGQPINLPAFKGWQAENGDLLFPMLFITIACGACSGFHALIASGTTSKQLKTESDARPVAYGAMLLEGMVAVVSLCCVMMLAQDTELARNPKPNLVYALGIGQFLQAVNLPMTLGVSFALMAFTTFIYDTLDVCTRLGRYIIQELTGLRGSAGKWIGTLLTAGAPAYFLLTTGVDAGGRPAYMQFWSLFGASNQLLAALTLLGVTVWLWKTRGAWWVWLVTGLPAVWMYAMSGWALRGIIRKEFASSPGGTAVGWTAAILLGLAGFMLLEAVIAVMGRRIEPPEASAEAVPA
ncbi:MAG: carbon starvation protein A [Planctomyces sp.]|nr:carbon starvation protein A [Planctomyces sp.]